jgi:SAM-dependent methyltransferase
VADINALGEVSSLQARFDVIECIGVLHHLPAPEHGLASLVRCLRPGGLLRLELYSTAVREAFKPVWRMVAEKGLKPDLAGIRTFREAVFAAVSGGGAPEGLQALTRSDDFYSASGCRDVAFHPQERGYTPREFHALVTRAGLRFLGFRPQADGPYRHYCERFPEDPLLVDPGKAETFEREVPRGLSGWSMYRAWMQKPS